ncbi:unnamed protein product [Ixodes persulcatus]
MFTKQMCLKHTLEMCPQVLMSSCLRRPPCSFVRCIGGVTLTRGMIAAMKMEFVEGAVVFLASSTLARCTSFTTDARRQRQTTIRASFCPRCFDNGSVRKVSRKMDG